MNSGVVNRLDCETSGVLVVAKTAATFIDLRKRIGRKNDTSRKRYLSLVHGAVHGDNWRPVEGYCKWDTKWRRTTLWTESDDQAAAALPWYERGSRDSGGRLWAKTYLRPLIRFGGDSKPHYTLLECELVTGRRHQIRYHCFELDHPVVGDTKYGAPDRDRGWCARVFLHSYHTRMVEPDTGDILEVTAPLPKELVKVLVDLSSSSGHVVVHGEVNSLLIRGVEQSCFGTFFQSCHSESLRRIESSDAYARPCKTQNSSDSPRLKFDGSKDTEAPIEPVDTAEEGAETSSWKLMESRNNPGCFYRFDTETGISKPVPVKRPCPGTQAIPPSTPEKKTKNYKMANKNVKTQWRFLLLQLRNRGNTVGTTQDALRNRGNPVGTTQGAHRTRESSASLIDVVIEVALPMRVVLRTVHIQLLTICAGCNWRRVG